MKLNVSDLIKPISQDQPIGNDLRLDLSSNSLYYKIKDARNHARRSERLWLQGEQHDSIKQYWNEVYELAIEIFTHHSKDLEICAWYIEALLRRYNFIGLAQGFKLTRLLLEKYSNKLYPSVEKNNYALKLSAIAGLNGCDIEGTLIFPISNVIMIKSESLPHYTLWQYEQTLVLKESEKKRTQLARINKSIKETSQVYFKTLSSDLSACIHEHNALTKLLDKLCQKQSPPSSQIKESLSHYQSQLKGLIQQYPIPDTNHDLSNKTSNLYPSTTSFKDREQVLRSVLEAADYFKANEPHSPLPYLLERAVHWGRLPLPELLNELINNEQERKAVFHLTGIKGIDFK